MARSDETAQASAGMAAPPHYRSAPSRKYCPLLVPANQQGAVPHEEFPHEGDVDQEAEVGKISRRGSKEAQLPVLSNGLECLPDVSGKQRHERRMQARAFHQLVVEHMTVMRAQVMEGREFVPAPRRKPVGPTQEQHAFRTEEFLCVGQK